MRQPPREREPADTDWHVKGTRRDAQSITRDWQLVHQELIDGVVVRQVANVMTDYGRLTELHRGEWDDESVGQVFQSVFDPGGISAWHAHEHTLDRLSVTTGRMLIVLYDARVGSSTFGQVNYFRLGEHQPATVRIPPRVWHGVKNIGSETSVLVNVVDEAYAYEEPDHYRAAMDSEEIPFDILSAR